MLQYYNTVCITTDNNCIDNQRGSYAGSHLVTFSLTLIYLSCSTLCVPDENGNKLCCRILIEAGAKIDARDLDGWTPFHAAAHWGQEESCKVLVENFCNMDVKNGSVSLLS